jgi:hypothetical protein
MVGAKRKNQSRTGGFMLSDPFCPPINNNKNNKNMKENIDPKKRY